MSSAARSYLSAAATLVGCTIGAGVVSLPAAFQEVGLGPSLVLMVLSAALTWASLLVSVRAAELSRARSFGELSRVFGKAAQLGSEALTVIVLVGVTASMLRLCEDCLDAVIPANAAVAPRGVVLIVAFAVALPLSLTPAIMWLQHASYVAIIALLYVLVLLVIHGAERAGEPAASAAAPPGHGPDAHAAWSTPSWTAALTNLPVFVYALGCQVQVVPLFAELPASHRAVWPFTLVACGASVLATGVAYTTAGVFGVFAFGNHGSIAGDVVSNMDQSSASQAARVMLCISCAAVVPLLIWPQRNAIAALLTAAGFSKGSDREPPTSAADSSTATTTALRDSGELDARLLPVDEEQLGSFSVNPTDTRPEGRCSSRIRTLCCQGGLLQRLWIGIVLMACAAVIAFVVPSIKVVFEVVGASGASIMFFIIPGSAILRADRLHVTRPRSSDAHVRSLSFLETAIGWTVLGLGWALLVACTWAVASSL